MGEVRPCVPSGSKPVNLLRDALHDLSIAYGSSYLDTDPLRYPHRYRDPLDREGVALISSVLAFGNVKAIFRSLEWILTEIGPHPHEAILHWPKRIPSWLTRFQHRWVRGSDLHLFFSQWRSVIEEYGSLERAFMRGYQSSGNNMVEAMDRFVMLFQVGFLLPSPKGGSCCKRLNLFLRWMVRRTAPDLGLWTALSPSSLYLPVDTHLGRLARYVGLTRRRTLDWKFVEEATVALRILDPEDPIRYDFPLSRLGIVKDCRHRRIQTICGRCPLDRVCILPP